MAAPATFGVAGRGDRAACRCRITRRGSCSGVRGPDTAQRANHRPLRSSAGRTAREHGRPHRHDLGRAAQRPRQQRRPRRAHHHFPAATRGPAPPRDARCPSSQTSTGTRAGIPVITPGTAVELDRAVAKKGTITLSGAPHLVGFAWAGRKLTLRMDGHLMHAITDNALIGTWPCPVPSGRLARLQGARPISTPLPPLPLPDGSLRAQRRVHASGRIVVASRTSNWDPATPASSSPSSSKTPTCASCTEMKNSPSALAATSTRSPASCWYRI